MRTAWVGTFAGLIAVVGLAGTANASATVDLIWQGSGTSVTSGLAISDVITLDVMLTAGPNGSNGGSVSVDYSAVVGTLTVVGYSNTLDGFWGLSPAGPPTDPGDNIIHTINAGSICGVVGSCLANTETARLGTVSFRVDALPGGSAWDQQALLDLVRRYLDTDSGAGAHERFMSEMERLLLGEALERTGGNQTQAALLLGITRPTLHAKLQRYRIDPSKR